MELKFVQLLSQLSFLQMSEKCLKTNQAFPLILIVCIQLEQIRLINTEKWKNKTSLSLSGSLFCSQSKDMKPHIYFYTHVYTRALIPKTTLSWLTVLGHAVSSSVVLSWWFKIVQDYMTWLPGCPSVMSCMHNQQFFEPLGDIIPGYYPFRGC